MNTQPLTKGFQQVRFDNEAGVIYETLFAVLPSGSVLKADECVKSGCFFEGKRKWSRVEAKPEGLEFIGNYRLPATMNKLAA